MATADDPVAALTQRLDAVEAVLEIQRLKAQYAELVDARYMASGPAPDAVLATLADRVAELFTTDAVWDGGPGLGVAQGRAEIAARLRRPTLRFARHLFTSPRIEVDGDQATGRWELLSPLTTADGTHAWMAGVEQDTYRRVGGRWLHASMALTTTFVGPVGQGWDRILGPV